LGAQANDLNLNKPKHTSLTVRTTILSTLLEIES
jgi:hypothetical protein